MRPLYARVRPYALYGTGLTARPAPRLGPLPEDMSVRQWVWITGDPPRRVGSEAAPIGHLRRRARAHQRRSATRASAAHTPALVAVQYDRHIGAFYEKLLARGKKPIVATVAVMRKLLHAIYGMPGHGQDFHGPKFYATPQTTPATA